MVLSHHERVYYHQMFLGNNSFLSRETCWCHLTTFLFCYVSVYRWHHISDTATAGHWTCWGTDTPSSRWSARDTGDHSGQGGAGSLLAPWWWQSQRHLCRTSEAGCLYKAPNLWRQERWTQNQSSPKTDKQICDIQILTFVNGEHKISHYLKTDKQICNTRLLTLVKGQHRIGQHLKHATTSKSATV